MCSVVTVLVGTVCFGERLGWHTGLGMLLAVVAVILLGAR
jgi:drug/metabolite transporter (DMT)-like permease